jgi:ATP-dependent Lon protease
MSSDPPQFSMPKGGGPQSPPAAPPSEEEADATPRLAEEIRGSQVFEVIEQLDRELVGLVPVKTRIREVASLLLVDRMRRSFGLDSDRPTLHMCFTGSPGTGKTTVAVRMAEV